MRPREGGQRMRQTGRQQAEVMNRLWSWDGPSSFAMCSETFAGTEASPTPR